MKRIFSLLLAFLIVLSCAACTRPSAGFSESPGSSLSSSESNSSASASGSPASTSEASWEDYYQEALKQIKEDHNEKAVELFMAALDLDTSRPEIWLSMAKIIREDPVGYLNTLQEGLKYTGDSNAFQPLIDEALAEQKLREDAVIVWVDPEMEKLVRDYLKKPSGEIRRSELDGVESIALAGNAPLMANQRSDGIDWGRSREENVYYLFNSETRYDRPCPIKTLEDLKNFRNLADLAVYYSQLANLEGLCFLKGLYSFTLFSTPVSDISPVAELFRLQSLMLTNCGVRDISAVAGLSGLCSFSAGNNEITDLSALSGLFRLEKIQIFSNKVSDLAPLAGLSSLAELDAGDNQITDPTPICSLPSLKSLILYINPLTTLDPLGDLPALRYLNLVDCKISDIEALSSLNMLEELQIGTNQILDISPLMSLKSLQRLSITNNPVTDVTPLLALKKLTYLEAFGISSNFTLLGHIPEQRR